MFLGERLEKQGAILFRWRSYLPLVLVPIGLLAASDSGYFESWFGETAEKVWDAITLAIAFAGLSVRAFVVGYAPKGTAGRGTKKQRADSLNTTGIYATVRNPLYLGNALIFLGFMLATKVWWFVLLGTVSFIVYYERIIHAEETFLHMKFGKAYADWARRTPALIPNPRLWRRPELPFSFRTVLRREFHAFYLIIVVMTLNEIAGDVLGEGIGFKKWLAEDFHWVVLFGLGTFLFLTLMALKKFTRILRVPGR